MGRCYVPPEADAGVPTIRKQRLETSVSNEAVALVRFRVLS